MDHLGHALPWSAGLTQVMKSPGLNWILHWITCIKLWMASGPSKWLIEHTWRWWWKRNSWFSSRYFKGLTAQRVIWSFHSWILSRYNNIFMSFCIEFKYYFFVIIHWGSINTAWTMLHKLSNRSHFYFCIWEYPYTNNACWCYCFMIYS